MIRVLIVDDERPAREGLRLRLERVPGFEVVGEASSGRAAIRAVEKHAPDMMLLDIRMPDLNGFEVLQRIPPARRPRVIFVTAHDRHALRAFEAHALDYLLKPIAPRRFDEALNRARTAHAQHLATRTLEQLARDLRGEEAVPDAAVPPARVDGGAVERLTVRDGAGFRMLPVANVRWIEASGNYVTLHTADRAILHRASLGELETLLGPGFKRIHRGVIVNVAEIAEIRPVSHGDFEVVLREGTVLRMSRRYRDSVL